MRDRIPLGTVASTYYCHPQWTADLINLTNQQMHLSINISTYLNIFQANCVENEQTICAQVNGNVHAQQKASAGYQWIPMCVQWYVALEESMLTASLTSHLAKREHRIPQNIFKSTYLRMHAFIFWLCTEQTMERLGSFHSPLHISKSISSRQIEKTFVLLSRSFFNWLIVSISRDI